jgi:hypothetical protein
LTVVKEIIPTSVFPSAIGRLFAITIQMLGMDKVCKFKGGDE